MICYETEFVLPTEMTALVWTANGPEQVVDQDRARRVVYYLFEPGSDFKEVADKFSEMKDGNDTELADDAAFSQENENENMPVFSLTGTLTTY